MNQLLLALESKYKLMTFELLLYIALTVVAVGVSGVAGFLLVYFSVFFRSDCQDFGNVGSREAKRIGSERHLLEDGKITRRSNHKIDASPRFDSSRNLVVVSGAMERFRLS